MPNPEFSASRLRVAIVAPSLSILGGQAVQAQRLVDAWNEDPEVYAWLVPINPMPPRSLTRVHETKYLRTVLTQLQYWPSLVRQLKKADVVHVFSASYSSFLLAPLPATIVAKAFGRPVLINYRSGEAPDHLRRSWIARTTLKRVDRNVVPSKFLARVFAEHGIDAAIVPNTLDRKRFPFRLRERLRPRLLSTRNFEPLYNVECTLRAFRRIQDTFPEAELTIIGKGSQGAKLRELARTLALRHVAFVGSVPPSEIGRYYADADIYLQTPNIDNMPNSVLEAFATGLPVVSTDAGGVSTILRHESEGLLVPVGDDAAAADAVRRLLTEPNLAKQLVLNAFETTAPLAWEAVRSRWISIYRDLLAPPAAATVDQLG